MDEMELYRAKIEKRYHDRRKVDRRDEGGRRKEDYKSPPFFTLGFIVQFLTLIIGGFILLVVAGCVSIKKTITGG